MEQIRSFEANQERAWHNVADIERWGSLAAGVAMLAYGLRRSSTDAWMAAVAATPLVHRGLTGHCYVYEAMGVNTARTNAMEDTSDALSGPRGIHVREAVRIEKPIEEIYRFWRNLENLPHFMTYLERVTDLGNGRSHWVAKGPAGSRLEWDAEIINEVENKVIGWRSLPGADVVTAGSVSFEPVRDGSGTQISVNLQYAPPAGRAGSAIAWLMGREPSQTIREDLRRLKQSLEAGEIPTSERTKSKRTEATVRTEPQPAGRMP